MGMDVIDESTRAAVRRLTKAERECLKRCLRHQTAKQMALDLGISPHAVEKRLKMARAKLGLSSSFEAAKLVESLDQVGRLVPQSRDLCSRSFLPDEGEPEATPRIKPAWATRRRTYVVSGAMLMSVIAAIALVLVVPSSGAVERAATVQAYITSAPPAVAPNPGTEAALRHLVAGLSSGTPNYAQLAPVFAEIVRRDLPWTHGLFSSLGDLKSITFRGRGRQNDDVYTLVFAHGELTMSAGLDPDARMSRGILKMEKLPAS